MLYMPGHEVPYSGIYAVTHDPEHAREHEVTCIKGRKFPSCRNCKGVRFKLKVKIVHVEDHLYFKTDDDLMKAGMQALSGSRKKKSASLKAK
jgi:hypothetical protein